MSFPVRRAIFFFNDTATTEIYTLSLHDALPILWTGRRRRSTARSVLQWVHGPITVDPLRSEEHTSELQSHLNLVCRLLLEKKNSRLPMMFILWMVAMMVVIIPSRTV